MNKDIYILGIESSCDDTSVAVVKNGREILSNVISSQIDIHTLYGGVVPEIASRNHTKNIKYCLDEALKQAHLSLDDISAIAVTYGAGLLGSLIIGVSFAKMLSYMTGKPLYAVNHIEGHISANYLEHKDLEPPFMCLVVSGGHTALFNQTDYCHKDLICTTVDDAIGEAFDKVARELGLGYPGGPKIQKMAEQGKINIKFMASHTKIENFSYSGLKTAVINYLHNKKQRGEEINVVDVCASFQDEAVNQLAVKIKEELEKSGTKKLVLAGGVSANSHLREVLKGVCDEVGAKLYCPSLTLCTDNAGMIASQAYYNYINGAEPASMDLSPKSVIKL